MFLLLLTTASHLQGKQRKAPGDKCAWPQKATKAFLDLLRNAEANAEDQHLDKANLNVKHVSCQRAPKMRRRTYRAHGRINGECHRLYVFLCLRKSDCEGLALGYLRAIAFSCAVSGIGK